MRASGPDFLSIIQTQIHPGGIQLGRSESLWNRHVFFFWNDRPARTRIEKMGEIFLSELNFSLFCFLNKNSFDFFKIAICVHFFSVGEIASFVQPFSSQGLTSSAFVLLCFALVASVGSQLDFTLIGVNFLFCFFVL